MTAILTKTAGLFCERRFGMAELSYYQGAVVLPEGRTFFGISGTWFGTTGYGAWKAGLAAARKLSGSSGVGVQFFYAQQHTAGYRNQSSVSMELGFIFHLTPSLLMGIQARHPFTSLSRKAAPDAAVYTLCYSYRPSPQLLLQTELIKKENDPFELHATIRYAVDSRMHGTLGMAIASGNYYFGGGVLLQEFGIDAVLHCHHALGISPGLLLTYRRP